MGVKDRCLMTWQANRKRWRKIHKGQLFQVTCSELGVPSTKEESYQAANAWWRERLAGAVEPHPHASVLEELTKRRDWAMRDGQQDLASIIERERSDIERGDRPTYLSGIDPWVDVDAIREQSIDDEVKGRLDSGDVFDAIDINNEVWNDRIERSDVNSTPENQSIGWQVDQWLFRQLAKVQSKDMTPGRYDNLRRAIHHFRDFAIGYKAVRDINETTVDAFFEYCGSRILSKLEGKAGGWSPDYAKFVYDTSKAFINACYRRRLLDLPRNLDEHRIEIQAKTIRPIPIKDFLKMLGAAKGQLQLHLLLMLNCGMRSTDISDLLDSEVDWVNGRIVRQRSKTRKHHADDVPTVHYRLWTRTFALLQEHRSGEDIVLKTKSGGLWAWEEMVNGKLKSSDNIATNYNRLMKKLGVKYPLSSIRKRGASTLESHENYGRYTNHYLGESPRSIKDKHYAEPSVDVFDAAIGWLGERFGFVED